jgi:hypothetical protein
MHKFLFHNKFIIFLYMFRTLLCSSSGGQIVLYSIRYHHTETSDWYKITKIQFYKYEHIVVKFMYEFFECNYCIFVHYIWYNKIFRIKQPIPTYAYSEEIYSNHTLRIRT